MASSSGSSSQVASPFADHDHARCRSGALATAERVCRDAGLRMTETRRRVLEILLESHAALGAYEVLARLNGEGRNAQPPVAYRALDFLRAHGFVHRIESMNAFVACVCPEESHRPAFLICRGCHKVAETPALAAREAIAPQAESLGFQVDAVSVEALGHCPACAAGDRA